MGTCSHCSYLNYGWEKSPPPPPQLLSVVKVKVILRPTVCQSVRLGFQAPIWDPWPIFFFWQFWVYWCWARSWVSTFQFLPGIASAQPFSDLSPTGLMSIVFCLYFSDSPNQEGQVPIFISPRNRVAQLYPRALGYCSHIQQVTVRQIPSWDAASYSSGEEFPTFYGNPDERTPGLSRNSVRLHLWSPYPAWLQLP
jgi:hypothetical protein